MATYLVDLEKVTFEQFNPGLSKSRTPSVIAVDQDAQNLQIIIRALGFRKLCCSSTF